MEYMKILFIYNWHFSIQSFYSIKIFMRYSSSSFYKKIDDQGIKVVGRPNLSPERMEIGKDVKFKATFEVYPEIKVNNLNKYDLDIAETHGELNHLASVVINEDDIIRDSLKYQGPRVLTFSSIIKYESFELNTILNEFIKEGEKFIGCPFEIEFAVNLNKNQKSEFCLLQVKPMSIDSMSYNMNILKNKKSFLSFLNTSKNIVLLIQGKLRKR